MTRYLAKRAIEIDRNPFRREHLRKDRSDIAGEHVEIPDIVDKGELDAVEPVFDDQAYNLRAIVTGDPT